MLAAARHWAAYVVGLARVLAALVVRVVADGVRSGAGAGVAGV